MDLGFARHAFVDAAARLAQAGARQAASATADAAHRLTARATRNPWLTPASGAFSAATAAMLTAWQTL